MEPRDTSNGSLQPSLPPSHRALAMARLPVLSLKTWLAASLLLVVTITLLTANRDHISLEKAPSIARKKPLSDNLDDITNSTLGFEKIFVINLPKRTDHRDAIDLAATFTKLHVTFVDAATNVTEKALPNGAEGAGLRQAELGNWRSHMDIARQYGNNRCNASGRLTFYSMVEANVQSALIMEDDADWDLRIKTQLHDFAKASRILLQPILGDRNRSTYLDPTYPRPQMEEPLVSVHYLDQYNQTLPAVSSPYGDGWDLLWLGHCGCRFPRASDLRLPLGRAVILDDPSVPPTSLLDMEFGNQELLLEYPEYSRVVSHAAVNTCTLAYALSLQGAKRMLYELSVHKFGGTTDMAIRGFCQRERTLQPTCLTVQPQLFSHHRPAGRSDQFSDISDHSSEADNPYAYTTNIRWSTRMNLPQLMSGSRDYVDLYNDKPKVEPTPISFDPVIETPPEQIAHPLEAENAFDDINVDVMALVEGEVPAD